MQQRCPNCGSPVAPGQRFCGGCGAQISLSCPQCRITVNPGTRFCPNCGAVLGGSMPQQPGGMPPQQQGWGQQPGGMPPQQPGWGQQPGWAPTAANSQSSSSRRPLLILFLFILLIGLGVLVYMYTPIGGTIKDLFQSATGGGTTTTVDTTEPEISQVQVTASTASARIDWETDEPASSQVEYGRDQQNTSFTEIEYDPTGGASAGVVTHSVTLTGLEPSTPAVNITYYYRVISKDASGNEAVSVWKTFETELSDT
jgi:hypothetical protein